MEINKNLIGWAAPDKSKRLEMIEKPIPTLKDSEILIEVTSCGICHSDIHLIDNDWMISEYPLVPGHEIIGRVAKVGSNVSHLKVGTNVGVGWQRSSCGHCEECTSARDNNCSQGKLATCVGHWGGYANYHITDSRYAFEMPKDFTSPQFAPLLCGGATVFGPLLQYATQSKLKPARVGIIGVGGLGHIAVKIAVAMGFEVSVFSSSPNKKDEVLKMGAQKFISSKTEEEIMSVGSHFDLLLATANVDLPWGSYLETLRTDGTLCFVGVPPSPASFHIGQLLDKQRRISGSVIGSRSTIRQMLEFCALHEIGADIETFKMTEVNQALDKVRNNQVHYRAVLVP